MRIGIAAGVGLITLLALFPAFVPASDPPKCRWLLSGGFLPTPCDGLLALLAALVAAGFAWLFMSLRAKTQPDLLADMDPIEFFETLGYRVSVGRDEDGSWWADRITDVDSDSVISDYGRGDSESTAAERAMTR